MKKMTTFKNCHCFVLMHCVLLQNTRLLKPRSRQMILMRKSVKKRWKTRRLCGQSIIYGCLRSAPDRFAESESGGRMGGQTDD